MGRAKYYYDTETCKYERVRKTTQDVLLQSFLFLCIACMAGFGFTYVYIQFNSTPQEAILKKENKELKLYYKMLDKQMKEATDMLAALQQRDDNIYRVVFEAEPIPASVRKAGVGGINRYQHLLDKGLEREDLIVSTSSKLDQLKKQMYIQTKSYDEIVKLAESKNEMLSSIPAIQPIHNKNLKIMTSGYGNRIDPIYKTTKFHAGIDFAAPTGTKIYATGKGTVMLAGSEGAYGQSVVLDHGFGYQSRYAHMSKVAVKAGQKVKRGDLIGYVGNTGKSTGPHLHYEVVKGGQRINPINFFFNDLSPADYNEMLKQSSNSNQSFD
jgi:murein DD-endopeptidase MepM/ murein hydrolase activator NlpD